MSAALLLMVALAGQYPAPGATRMGQEGGVAAVRIPAFGPPVPVHQDLHHYNRLLRPPQGKYPWYLRTGPAMPLYSNPNYDPAKVDRRGFRPASIIPGPYGMQRFYTDENGIIRPVPRP